MMTSREFLLLLLVAFVLADDDIKFEGDYCFMRNGTAGVCRKIGDCDWFRIHVQNHSINYSKDVVRCGFDKKDEIICCPDEKVTLLNGRRRSETACDQFKLQEGVVDHILGGESVEDGELPFIAALKYNSSSGRDEEEWACGATLISEKFVLTAAHCVKKSNEPVMVRFGVVDLKNNFTNPVDRSIKRIVTHPEYRTRINDIALIELEQPILPSYEVMPACLYSKREDLDQEKDLQAAGWGSVSTVTGRTSPFSLQKVNLKTVTLRNCAAVYNPILQMELQPSHYCAIGKEQGELRADTCQGDSGGPLEIKEDDRFHLVGVISFGLGCGTDKPGIYSRVAHYLDWIERIVWP